MRPSDVSLSCRRSRGLPFKAEATLALHNLQELDPKEIRNASGHFLTDYSSARHETIRPVTSFAFSPK